MAKAAIEKTEARFERGDLVEVREVNIRPWRGVVGAVKFSPQSGWWVDVRRDGEGWETWSVQESLVEVVEREVA